MIFLKLSTKFLSLILTIILIFSPIVSLSAAAVEYPKGVTEEQIQATIPKLNSLLKAILSMSEETKDLKGTVYGMLYEDATVNTIFKEIYTALAQNADSLSVIGVDISPAALAAALDNYPSISKKIASCADINAVIAASEKFSWEIDSKNKFSNAVAAMLSPFNALLNALLCSGSVKINSLLAIQGDDGYSNAIVPLLKALDCPEIMSTQDFAASAAKNQRNIIKNILSMAFASLDRLLENPVTGLCSTLPKIAYYLNSGKLSASITSLLEPLSVKVAGIFTIAGISDLITSAVDLEEGLNINEMLEGFDLSSLLGSDVQLQLPEIDLAQLAECVTANGDDLTTDEAAAFVVIMNFLIETIKLNKNELGAMLGGSGDMSALIDPLLAKTNDELIKTVVMLFNMSSIPANNTQWSYPTVNSTAITYTPTLTANDYLTYLDKIDPLLTDFVKESDPEGTIEDTLRKTLFSNSLVSTLVTGIFGMLATEETKPLFALLGMDVSPSGVASSIEQYYPYTARQLYKYASWDRVKTSYLSWGFYDGDVAGFTKAVTRVLSPFTPLLSCILAGQNMTFFDAITIPGADGYNTAVIPLLEALGCKADTIKTYEEYKKGAGTQAVITDILTPVTALLEEVCASPVKSICTILPNVVYFFNSGLMDNVLTNLLYPVQYMLDTIGMGELLKSAFSDTQQMDLNSLIKELTSGADLGITLPELDVTVIGTLGTAATLTSKRTVNGANAQYTYLTADTPAVFLTLLRYFVGALSMEENSGLLTGLMGSDESAPSEDGMPDMFAMYAGNITEKFKGMTTDEIIEWLCDLLFSESPVVELPVENEEIPTIIYEEKFELSTTAKLIIVVAVIALAALLYYILSVSGKLDNIKLKHRKKQEIKRRKKESKKLIKGGGVAVDAIDETTLPERKKKALKAEKISISEKEAEPLTEKQIKKLEKQERSNDKKDLRTADKKLPNAKEAEKLARRQQQAVKRARKNEIRIQKQYEKAKRQALKKNSK